MISGKIITVSDLSLPITAAKADWSQASEWMGFTPTGTGHDAKEKCQSTILKQANKGYVIEYITKNSEKPNLGYETDPAYLKTVEKHKAIAGRLIAVHRLRHTSRNLIEIMGSKDFESLQDMWGRDGKRHRWSVAFPIVESYQIIDLPLASDVFSTNSMKRLFKRQSSTLRVLNFEERQAIASLKIFMRAVSNAKIAIEDDFRKSEGSEIDPRIEESIYADLECIAIEGETKEYVAKVKKRAAWLANEFIREKQNKGLLFCEQCGFNPKDKIQDSAISLRTLLDVHHKDPLAEGKRETKICDFALLCPTCHRFEHAMINAQKK